MAINFLGGEEKRAGKRESTQEVKMHLPEEKEESIEKKVKAEKLVTKKPKEILSEEVKEEVNLISAFKSYLLKRRLTFIALSVIIIIGLAAGVWAYFSFFYKQSMPIVSQENINKPVAAIPKPQLPQLPSPPTPAPLPQPTPQLPVSPPPPLSPQPLPNTELALLRGALVAFTGATERYLVENNGELREIDISTVVFANGKNISQINSQLIYKIADRFKNIRRGKEVIGFVAWDPRVLTPSELAPFL